MYPVTFKEYLRSADNVLYNQLLDFIGNTESIPSILFNRIEEFYHSYQICGGLPLSARSMIDNSGLENVEKILEENLMAYEIDFSKHSLHSDFKVYLLDIGLLRKLSKLPAEIFISSTNLFTEFKGALAENFVLTSLLAQGFDIPNYWTLQGNKAEVDFLIANKLSVIPIEVKSDKRISGKSFAEYDKKYNPSLRIRLSMNNIKKDGNLLNLPIFMADWIKEYV